MLTLESPVYEISGVLVYRDHAIPSQFYYAAPPPRIARANGRLMFDILGYIVNLKQSMLSGTQIPEELGAGFLTMGTECVLTDGQREDLLRGLAEQSGIGLDAIALYPIPYHKGTVSILALDQYTSPGAAPAAPDSATPLQGRPTFVERILGSGKPSLLGDLRTIFSLSLSQDGLTFMQGLYQDRAAPVGVVYDLSFYGLRPAVDVHVTADLTRVYQHFGGGLSFQYQWVAADVQAGLDRLREQGAIKIEITSQATGDAAQKAQDLAMSLFRDQIVQQMFRPTAPSGPPAPPRALGAAGGQGTTGQSKALLTLRADYKLTEESKSVTYDFSQRAPEERTHAPQGFLPVLLSRAELQQHIHMIDLDNPFFDELQVLVSGPSKDEFQSLGIRQVQAVLAYGQLGDPVPPESETLVFRPDSTGDKTLVFKRQGRPTLAYTAALEYEFTRTSGSSSDSFSYQLPPGLRTDRSVAINPYADFGILDVDVEPGRIHADVKQVDVALSYAGADPQFHAEQHFRIVPGNPQDAAARRHWQVRTRQTDVRPYTAAYTFTFQDGSTYQAPARTFTDALLEVDTPFMRDRELLIRPNPTSPDVNLIVVELDYHDPANDYRRTYLVNLAPPFASVRQTWPILDPNAQAVRYRVTTQEPGMSSEGEWLETSDPSIVVGAVAHRVAKLPIQLIGPTLGDVGVDALQVKVVLVLPNVADGDPQTVLIQPGQFTAELDLILPPGVALHYRWQTVVFKSTGETVESDWIDGTTTPLIISTRKL